MGKLVAVHTVLGRGRERDRVILRGGIRGFSWWGNCLERGFFLKALECFDLFCNVDGAPIPEVPTHPTMEGVQLKCTVKY